MISSTEDSFALLRKWNSEKAPMHFVFAFPWGGGSFAGTVSGVTRETARLAGSDSHSEFVIALSDARFEYDDPREAPEALRDKTDLCVGRLTAELSNGDKIAFFELRIN
jgi:hypothetical protein